MKVLQNVYLSFKNNQNLRFRAVAGETSRGIRVNLEEDTASKEFKNFIKVDDKIYETKVTNVEKHSFDILFPALQAGEYLGEIHVIENTGENERIKSGIYQIRVEESLTSEEAEKMEQVDSEAILERLNQAEKNLVNKIEIFDKAIAGRGGLSAYEVWLAQGNSGTEQDFLESLKGKSKNYSFILDEEGNLFVDIE